MGDPVAPGARYLAPHVLCVYDDRMDKRAAVVLRISAIWAVWVWAVLIKNMISDHNNGLAFRLVHIGLAVISIAFAVATWLIVRRLRAATKGATIK